MKQVVAIIKPHQVEAVLDALREAPLVDCTISEVKGFGRQKSYLDEYHDSEYSLAFLPKVEVSLWIKDADTETIVRTLIAAARTGRMGDGKIFILPSGEEITV